MKLMSYMRELKVAQELPESLGIETNYNPRISATNAVTWAARRDKGLLNDELLKLLQEACGVR